MKGLFGHGVSVLEKAIELRSKRNSILAGNIANLDTPAYRSRDIPFEQIMSELFKTKPAPDLLERTDPAHFDEQAQIDIPHVEQQEGDMLPLAASLAATDARHFITADNGENRSIIELSTERGTPNNVDIDMEMAQMAENNLQYQAAIQALVKHFELIRTAVTEGGKV